MYGWPYRIMDFYRETGLSSYLTIMGYDGVGFPGISTTANQTLGRRGKLGMTTTARG